jgi:hypothetical protein
MSLHNILTSFLSLGRDWIKLIIFTFSSKTSFREGGIFFFFMGMAVADAVATVALLDFLFCSWDNTGRLSSHGLRTVCAHINAVIPWDAAHCKKIDLLISKLGPGVA